MFKFMKDISELAKLIKTVHMRVIDVNAQGHENKATIQVVAAEMKLLRQRTSALTTVKDMQSALINEYVPLPQRIELLELIDKAYAKYNVVETTVPVSVSVSGDRITTSPIVSEAVALVDPHMPPDASNISHGTANMFSKVEK